MTDMDIYTHRSRGWGGPTSISGAEFEHDQDELLKKALVGRKIVAIDTEHDRFTLDNGVVLEAEGNEGCGGCSSGNFSAIVKGDAIIDNIITAVTVEDREVEGERYPEDHYSLFVFYGEEKVSLVEADGDWGNGYYGGGFSLRVVEVPGIYKREGGRY